MIAREYPDTNVEEELADRADAVDPYHVFRILLLPLEKVKQSAKWHPEGDALYHTLQVFEKAKDAQGYDEEFLLAALLHDVGKAIDPFDHVAAALESLDGLISARTAWLIEHHMIAHEYKTGTLGARARKRLEAHEDFEDLLLLRECDDGGRVPGARFGTVDQALDHVREVERQNRWK